MTKETWIKIYLAGWLNWISRSHRIFKDWLLKWLQDGNICFWSAFLELIRSYKSNVFDLTVQFHTGLTTEHCGGLKENHHLVWELTLIDLNRMSVTRLLCGCVIWLPTWLLGSFNLTQFVKNSVAQLVELNKDDK